MTMAEFDMLFDSHQRANEDPDKAAQRGNVHDLMMLEAWAHQGAAGAQSEPVVPKDV